MDVISIERSTYEELLTSFNNFVTKMKEMASRGNNKRLGDWLDNQDVCQMLNISPRTLQTLRQNGTLAYSQINRKVYYKPLSTSAEDNPSNRDSRWKININVQIETDDI